ncbi:MAG: NCS1 family nucleobase:cation symporter-1, partial [Bacteroidetes bacterium]|nr:NCS1 family nucleobase:cation symporter-1 [Bacteroidota bacterium]
PQNKRTWSMWNLAAIWVGMAVCIPTYILASYMIKSGLSWYAALIIIGLANLIITVPMVLNGHAGVKYGIPFPVLGRASFGTNGIHIASVVRGIVACGWFGVQTWIGGLAFYAIWNAITGSEGSLGLNVGKFVCFGLFWLVNIYFIWKGTESIKWLEDFAAPILVLIGILLITWGAYNAGGFKIVLKQSAQLEKPAAVLTYEEGIDQLLLELNPLRDKNDSVKATHYKLSIPVKNGYEEQRWKAIRSTEFPILLTNLYDKIDKEGILSGEKEVKVQFRADDKEFDFIFSSTINVGLTNPADNRFSSKMWSYLLWLTAMVGFWATMSLSIADITRYTSTQKEQVTGQFIGLPGTMILYSFVGIFVTCAAVINFKDILIVDDAPWDPVSLLARFENPIVVIISQIFMIIATLSTNIAANVIAPANAFSNLFPKRLTFRGGGIVTGIIGIIICPWWLLDEISGFLIFVSGLLGPVLGILLCDYYVIRKKTLQLAELYKSDGVYSYGGSGFNPSAMIALAAGVFLGIIGYWVPALAFLYNLSWFTGFLVSFVLYYYLMKPKTAKV